MATQEKVLDIFEKHESNKNKVKAVKALVKAIDHLSKEEVKDMATIYTINKAIDRIIEEIEEQ